MKAKTGMNGITKAPIRVVVAEDHVLPERRQRAASLRWPLKFYFEGEAKTRKYPHQVDPSRTESYAPLMPNLDLLEETGNPYPPTAMAEIDTRERYKPLVAVSHETYRRFSECEGLFNPKEPSLALEITESIKDNTKIYHKDFHDDVRSCIVDTMRDLALYGLSEQSRQGRERLFSKKKSDHYEDLELTETLMNSPKIIAPTTNLVLYGPPGTGKTYQTALEAVSLCIGGTEARELAGQSRAALMNEYKQLVAAGQIEFVTFHQSFSYEEFVEGLRPSTGGGEMGEDAASAGFSLEPNDGAFKRISERARLDKGDENGEGRLSRRSRIYKIQLPAGAEGQKRLQSMLDGNVVFTDVGGDIDWSDDAYDMDRDTPEKLRQQVLDAIKKRWNDEKDPEAGGKDPNIELTYSFRSRTQVNDYVVVADAADSFVAFGQITGEYEYDPEVPSFPHRRQVEWINKDIKNGSWKAVSGGRFSPHPYCKVDKTNKRGKSLDWDALEQIVLDIDPLQLSPNARPHVLIIDEINRANISKVFGELITLLETDKRLGAENEIRLRLPYSGTTFGVPANLHIVGTMNTADRSIALLDTALRRRFTFKELMPDPGVLGTDIGGINLEKLLSTLNERIEYLFDREHQIGHAYFTACKSREDVETAIRHKVIPLLTEYFYEDWSKVAAVLGETFKEKGFDGKFLRAREIAAPPGLDAGWSNGPRLRWGVKDRFDLSEFEVE